MLRFLEALSDVIAPHAGLEPGAIRPLFGEPPDPSLGDLSLPCFSLARTLRKDPGLIAADLARIPLELPWLARVEAAGPYLNFHLDPPAFAREVLREVEAGGDDYGRSHGGEGRAVVVDYSSPNIAKHLAVHHLRSTMIGNAIANLHRACGFQVVGINHIGDWGTSFGKLLTAVERFGAAEGIDERPLAEREDPIEVLNRLYTRFHEELASEPGLEEEARRWFQRLEDGDSTARARWQEIRGLSLGRFQQVYERLGVRFEEVTGESFFEDRMGPLIEELDRRGLLEESEDAQVVRLEEGVPPMLIRKKDGATLYGTRDLAAADYRWERWRFDRCFYVVDAGQGLHFRQLFGVLRLLGREYAGRMKHVEFGVLRLPVAGAWVKGRTRHGRVVLLEEVLDAAVRMARDVVREKNPALEGADEVAEAVGIGAVIFSDLKSRRVKDVNFDLEQILSFEGETGPYLQYTHVRFCGIIRKSAHLGQGKGDGRRLEEPEELRLAKEIARYPDVVARAADEAEPSILSQYLLTIASRFNNYYAAHRILDDDLELARDRLALVRALRVVLSSGLRMLGIQPLERM